MFAVAAAFEGRGIDRTESSSRAFFELVASRLDLMVEDDRVAVGGPL
jgi:hypothetical protein